MKKILCVALLFFFNSVFAASTHDLIKLFRGKWDHESLRYKDYHFTVDQFIDIIEEYNSQFTPFHNPENDFGFIQKKDVSHNTVLFVRADLHGDLHSLMENLETLRRHKCLDKNYRCKKKMHLVFLGDYVDRGYHNLEVLALLACLKRENPDQVFLIRGNHETTWNKEGRVEKLQETDPNFAACLSDREKAKKIEQFFDTMPLALYISEKNKGKGREYVLFTHTMVELKSDPAPLLDSKKNRAVRPISKTLKVSKRFRSLASKNEAARKILDLIVQESGLQPPMRSTYNWGNLVDVTHIGSVDEDEWGLSVEDCLDYLSMSSDNHTVEMLVRGHDHTYKHETRSGSEEVFITTLPVGVTSPTAKKRGHSHDVGYLLKTHQKVKNWKKRQFLRAPEEIETHVLPPQSLQDLD